MRVLWFTNTPSCYCDKQVGYNGGGWIFSLEKELRKSEIGRASCRERVYQLV